MIDSSHVADGLLARPKARTQVRALVAAISAIALEGYDLTIYGLFAVTISRVFFPAGNETNALLLTVGTLGVGYVVRPLGAIVLGAYADRAGRTAAIVLTVILMAASTGIIGLIPSYSAIGVLAPVCVVIARLVQGFAAGGAAGGSIAYLSEAAPPGKRGFYASWQQASQVGAFLFSTAIAALITNSMSSDSVELIGWRIPFLLAILFGPIALLVRLFMPDPEIYVKAVAQEDTPTLVTAVRDNANGILIGFGVTCLWSITGFLLLIFMPTYANRAFGIPLSGAFLSGTVGGAIVFVLCPVMGALSDRFGRRATMLVSAAAIGMAIYPLFSFVNATRTVNSLIVAQAVLAVFIAGYTGPVSAFMAELFPTRSRSTGLSIAYNIAVLVVGAFSPLVATWLINITHDPVAPAWYIIAGAAVSVAALLASEDRSRKLLSS
jgi:MFS transporter, MHS family, proline/betaine transporter